MKLMNTIKKSILLTSILSLLAIQLTFGQIKYQFELIQEFNLGQKVGFVRVVPVQIPPSEKGLLYIYSADKDIDPWEEMFYIPTDRVKLAMYSNDGKLIWKKTLGKGTINGNWFTPVFPFDLNSDGSDEIYFVENRDSIHILSTSNTFMTVLNSKDGSLTNQIKWKRYTWDESMSYTYRYFIFGGFVQGKPVLMTASGTYGIMGLAAWNTDLNKRWEIVIDKNTPGARGSHMCPVVDYNHDGNDEIFWGERCISLDNGNEIFTADKNEYSGHSDVIQPTLNRETKTWSLFTCRESGDKGQIKPRVVMFSNTGERIWHDLDSGHMDMGWTAHMSSNQIVAFTISRGNKVAGPGGFFRSNVVEYAYNATNGEKINLNFPAYNTIPVDLNGDGYHEFASAMGEQSNRNIYSGNGDIIGKLGENAYIALASKVLNLPGEQILCYYPDGTIRIWANKNASDTNTAHNRYNHPYYKLMQRYTAIGYNLVSLGGL